MFFVPSWHTLMKQLVVPLDVPQWNSSKHQWPYMFPFLPWHPLVKPSIVPPDVLWWNNWHCQWPYMFPTKRISSLCSREIFSLIIFLLGGVWIQMIHVGLQNLVAGHITCHISSRTCYIVWICNMLDSWVNILYSTFITWRITGDNSKSWVSTWSPFYWHCLRDWRDARANWLHDSISGASAELDAGVRASVSRARIFRSFCASFWVFFLSGGHDFGNNAGVRDEAVERLSLNDSISLLLAVRAKQVFRISDPRELCKIQVRPVRASKFSYLWYLMEVGRWKVLPADQRELIKTYIVNVR